MTPFDFSTDHLARPPPEEETIQTYGKRKAEKPLEREQKRQKISDLFSEKMNVDLIEENFTKVKRNFHVKRAKVALDSTSVINEISQSVPNQPYLASQLLQDHIHTLIPSEAEELLSMILEHLPSTDV